jgi:hypothetical protein
MRQKQNISKLMQMLQLKHGSDLLLTVTPKVL